jgi:hypothetical protein
MNDRERVAAMAMSGMDAVEEEDGELRGALLILEFDHADRWRREYRVLDGQSIAMTYGLAQLTADTLRDFNRGGEDT